MFQIACRQRSNIHGAVDHHVLRRWKHFGKDFHLKSGDVVVVQQQRDERVDLVFVNSNIWNDLRHSRHNLLNYDDLAIVNSPRRN